MLLAGREVVDVADWYHFRTMNETLNIDFSDRTDVRAKLPQARRIREAKGAAVHLAQAEWEEWDDYVKTLERRAGVSDRSMMADEAEGAAPKQPSRPADERAQPARTDGAPLDLVVEVADRELRKIRAQNVWAILTDEGHELSKVAVSNALFYAAKRAKPPRLKRAEGRGFYAPLGYVEPPSVDRPPSDAPNLQQATTQGNGES